MRPFDRYCQATRHWLPFLKIGVSFAKPIRGVQPMCWNKPALTSLHERLA